MSDKTNNDTPDVLEPHHYDKTETETENSNKEDNTEPEDDGVILIHLSNKLMIYCSGYAINACYTTTEPKL